MAQRLYQQFQKSLVKEVVSVYAKIPIGATGAVGTLSKPANMGIKSVTRSSAGLYVITFGDSVGGQVDKYNSLIAVNAHILYNGVSAVNQIVTKVDSVTSGSISILCQGPTNSSTTTPVATDPDDGSILYIEIKLKNSSVQ